MKEVASAHVSSHHTPESHGRYRSPAVRRLADRVFSTAMGVGGISVIIAIVLIFFYLLYEVMPLFSSASIEQIGHSSTSGTNTEKTLGYVLDEQMDVAVRYTDGPRVIFFNPSDGEVIQQVSLKLNDEQYVTSWAQSERHSGIVALGLSDGKVLVVQHKFVFSFPNNVRTITPKLEYPFGREPLDVITSEQPVEKLAIQSSDEGTTIVAWSSNNPISVIQFVEQESFLGDDVSIERIEGDFISPISQIAFLIIDRYQQEIYLADLSGNAFHYSIASSSDISLRESFKLTADGQQLTALKFLNGDISLLAGDSSGLVRQFFSVRDDKGNDVTTAIRSFSMGSAAIVEISPEYNRKGFLILDNSGRLGVFHTTSERTLLTHDYQSQLKNLAIAPRDNGFIFQTQSGDIEVWSLTNDHPEVSWKSLWGKVWYESYPTPDYVWQSSAADNVFEPKFSLVPLAFGTLKAAFYAMLVAVPLAIFGAIYTAYFMAPRLRRIVKPTIEVMEALPTVILGFLAGLWLAPIVEKYLPGIFSLLIIVPLGCLMVSLVIYLLPERIRNRISQGWEALFLIPAVLIFTWLSLALSPSIESLFFAGDMKDWLTNSMAISFDQRNSIVVGLAMGFAVIPTIFSITEDSVFSVPKHLTVGSLALGATPWQTMTRVVILTASPGIFSAVMIGLGRAVGETMIVLMATGNTPIMDFSLFEGMRTLAANIAVEMPESEVGSTHYRVLFLAALVLFGFTFFMNTAAELIRHRLRLKYSSL